MAKKISPALHAQLTEKLEQLLDQQDDVASKKKTIVDAIKGQQKKIALGVSQTRRRLKGIDLEQTDIPGTEIAELGVDPVVEEILRQAGALKVVKDEEGSSPLKWAENDDEHTAEPEDGVVYHVARFTPGDDWWSAKMSSDHGTTWKKIAFGSPQLSAVKDNCARHYLERGADAILKSSGAGDLTKKGLKGDPTARKKGGRR
jgi:hypothetical protein